MTFRRRSAWTHSTPVDYFGERIGYVHNSVRLGGWLAFADTDATEHHSAFHGWSVRTPEAVAAQEATQGVFRTRRDAANALVEVVFGRREA